MEICRLCNNEAELQRSHIVPNSILKSVKAGESQLYVFKENARPVYRNVDPKVNKRDTHFNFTVLLGSKSVSFI
jgi:hypothetical protein